MLLISSALFLVVFSTYVLGVSPSVYGGDSGDIILSAWFGGIAHAPGYPINAMFGWVFTHAPILGSVAFKANLSAAFYQASVILVLFLICQKITKNTLVSSATALTLSFTALFWLYAHIIEVFQINTLLVALSIYFLISWREKELLKKPGARLLYVAILFLSLAIFHHQTSVLVVPAFAYLVLKTKKNILKNKKIMIASMLAAIAGFLPYLYLPFASIMDSPTNWGDATNLVNFIKIITRSEYGTFVAAGSLIGLDFVSRLSEIANYILFLRADFKILGIILIILGGVASFKRNKEIFWFLALAGFFTGPFFLFYSSFPFINDFYAGLWERFLLLSYFFCSLFIAYGYLSIVDFINSFRKAGYFKKREFYLPLLLLTLLVFIFPLHLFSTNRQKTDLSTFHYGEWLGNDILVSAEDNSVVFLLGDTQTFNAEYVYYTSGLYNSLKIIRGGSLSDGDYRAKLTRSYKDLDFPPDFLDKKNSNGEYHIRGLIERNRDKYPVYFYAEPVLIENYRWTNVGLLKKLVAKDNYSADEVVARNRNVYSKFAYKDFRNNSSYIQFMTTHLKESYYGALMQLSYELIDIRSNDAAKHYLSQAVEILPDKKDAYAVLGNLLLAKDDCQNASTNYRKVYEIDKMEWKALEAISKVYEECLGDHSKAEEFKAKANSVKSQLQKDTLN